MDASSLAEGKKQSFKTPRRISSEICNPFFGESRRERAGDAENARNLASINQCGAELVEFATGQFSPAWTTRATLSLVSLLALSFSSSAIPRRSSSSRRRPLRSFTLLRIFTEIIHWGMKKDARFFAWLWACPHPSRSISNAARKWMYKYIHIYIYLLVR
jgi:hypothetical protein